MRNRMPEIGKPERPKVEKMSPDELREYNQLPEPVRKKLEHNSEVVRAYAEQLEVGVTEYNGYAKYNNRLMNEAAGIKDKEETRK